TSITLLLLPHNALLCFWHESINSSRLAGMVLFAAVTSPLQHAIISSRNPLLRAVFDSIDNVIIII
ncbi:GNAT family N-acetyltransferase, partial [Escherichia coli]